MSEKESKYDISIAESNKKARNTVNSFKVRKSGNSSIVTVPDSIKDALHVEDGDQIQYVTVKDTNDESVVMIKKLKKDSNDKFNQALDDTLNDLDSILEALVEL